MVLLDMDGTLLDLRFDNYFWLELLPERFARRHGMAVEAARDLLAPRFAAAQGTLNWYCTDYWTRELDLDIAQLKQEVRERVRFLPGAEAFLAELERRGVPAVLVTNAHHDSLGMKAAQTGLGRWFRRLVSSHEYGAPKEDPAFWVRLEAELAFDPRRVLFVDDSLPVLRAARQHGIGHIVAVARPDSTLAVREIDEFPAVPGVAALLTEPAPPCMR